MRTVKARRSDLLKALLSNREGHKAEYNKAVEGYQALCLKVLEEYVASLKANRGFRVCITEVPPEDHTKDYDCVIRMLEMSVDEIVELTHSEFRQYVQDDWGWKEEWTISNSKYIARP